MQQTALILTMKILIISFSLRAQFSQIEQNKIAPYLGTKKSRRNEELN